MVSLALYDVPVEDRDYDWWDLRARDPHRLTVEEEKVIYGCGGLSYLRSYMKECGPIAASIRTVSEKHYFDCVSDCVCGRHPSPSDDKKDYNWWDARARDPTPLTTDEARVIWHCGGLSYLREYGENNGFDMVQGRSVSEKHFFDCEEGCVCGRK